MPWFRASVLPARLIEKLRPDSFKRPFRYQFCHDFVEFIEPVSMLRFFRQDHVDVLFFSVRKFCFGYRVRQARLSNIVVSS